MDQLPPSCVAAIVAHLPIMDKMRVHSFGGHLTATVSTDPAAWSNVTVIESVDDTVTINDELVFVPKSSKRSAVDEQVVHQEDNHQSIIRGRRRLLVNTLHFILNKTLNVTTLRMCADRLTVKDSLAAAVIQHQFPQLRHLVFVLSFSPKYRVKPANSPLMCAYHTWQDRLLAAHGRQLHSLTISHLPNEPIDVRQLRRLTVLCVDGRTQRIDAQLHLGEHVEFVCTDRCYATRDPLDLPKPYSKWTSVVLTDSRRSDELVPVYELRAARLDALVSPTTDDDVRFMPNLANVNLGGSVKESVQLLCRVESLDGLANISTPYVFAVHAEFMNALPNVKEVDVCALVTITGRSYKADRADWHTRCVHQIVDCIVAPLFTMTRMTSLHVRFDGRAQQMKTDDVEEYVMDALNVVGVRVETHLHLPSVEGRHKWVHLIARENEHQISVKDAKG